MKYYLGYYDTHEYRPIKSAEIGDTLMKVVDYTTSFTSIKKIKEDLFNKRLIPNPTVRIDYVIEKGPKDNKSYHILNSTDQIYTLEAKRFFDVATLKESLSSEANNSEFVALLNSKYIKKYGYINNILAYLLNLNESDLELILVKVKKIVLSDETKNAIENILNYINEHKGSINYDILDGYIESFIRAIKRNPYDITNMFIFFKKYIGFRTIPAMSYLSRWLQITIDESRNGGDFIDSVEEAANKESALNYFFNEIVYEFDYKKKEYKKENGKRKINYREMFDLGVFVADYYQAIYEEYVESMKSSNKYEEEDDSYDGEEEFLEEEDFARIGTTSEDAGYNLRRRDG